MLEIAGYYEAKERKEEIEVQVRVLEHYRKQSNNKDSYNEMIAYLKKDIPVLGNPPEGIPYKGEMCNFNRDSLDEITSKDFCDLVITWVCPDALKKIP